MGIAKRLAARYGKTEYKLDKKGNRKSVLTNVEEEIMNGFKAFLPLQETIIDTRVSEEEPDKFTLQG